MYKLNQKGGLDPLVIVLLVIVLALGGYVAYTFLEGEEESEPTAVETTQEEVQEIADEPETEEAIISATDESQNCGFSYPENFGNASFEPVETSVQGTYSLLSFSNNETSINLYCATNEKFEFKYFSGSKVSANDEGWSVVDVNGTVSDSDGTDETIGLYEWHKIATGDAGLSETIYLHQTQQGNVLGFGFSSEEEAKDFLSTVSDLN